MSIPLQKAQIFGEALEDIVRQYSDLIYRAAYTVTRNYEDAEDVLQTVFTALIRRGNPTELGGDFQTSRIKAYLYRMAVNEAVDLVKSSKRRGVVADLDSILDVVEAVQSSIDHPPLQDLRNAIGQLKREEVELLMLYYDQGYTAGEIARMTGGSRIKVSVDLHRLRRRLKEILAATEHPDSRSTRLSLQGGRS